MAIIAPFRGITYNTVLIPDLAPVVTPPYDVIAETEQAAYHEAHPHNVIRLILGEKHMGDSDWDNQYTRAADFFKRWQSENILIRSATPAVYLTSQTYSPGPDMPSRTRWGLIALVRIEEPGSEMIQPHERTFSAHREDRLKLMRACDAQFSQVFGLYEDPDNTLLTACRAAADDLPMFAFRFQDGTRHAMWVLNQEPLLREIAARLASRSILIADGHHRYETARDYRNLQRTRYGLKPTDRPFEYVMMSLTSLSDPGLTILPSHRLVRQAPGFDLANFRQRAAEWFAIEELPLPHPAGAEDSHTLAATLQARGRSGTAMLACFAGERQALLLTLRPAAETAVGEDLHPSLRRLDVQVLSRLILQRTLGFARSEMDNQDLFHYQSNFGGAIAAVQSGRYQMAFLLNPTRIEQVKEVARERLIMPRKSTYFYPKLLTGLVFNALDPHETIAVP